MDPNPPRSHLPRLQIETAEEDGTYRVSLAGELDLANCDEFRDAMSRAEDSEAARLLVDIDRLWFIDSTGLRVLLEATRRNAADRDRLRFTRGAGRVAEIFSLTAFDQALPFV